MGAACKWVRFLAIAALIVGVQLTVSEDFWVSVAGGGCLGLAVGLTVDAARMAAAEERKDAERFRDGASRGWSA